MVRRGASLVEVLVALVLTGAGVAAVVATGTAGARLTTTAERSTRALLIARDMLDSLAAAGTTTPGNVVRAGLRIDWDARPDRAGTTALLVQVRLPGDSTPLVRLHTRIAPALMRLR